MTSPVFPDDFKKRPHPIGGLPEFGKNWQWTLLGPSGDVIVSVVGGDFRGLHGDGVDTFEMWDFDEPEPQDWLTADQINEHLRTKNLSKA